MTDVRKIAGGSNGERGERGKRGPQGPTGPGGPATSLVGPTEGPGALIADENIPAGSVISADGSAILAVGNTDQYCTNNPGDNLRCKNCIFNPFTVPPQASCCIIGPSGCGTDIGVIGVASISILAGELAQYVAAGPLTLDTNIWDERTGGSGGLVPHAIYYLSASTPGHMTTVKPTTGDVVRIGVAFDARTLGVGIVPQSVNPSTEHLVTVNNPAITVISPMIDVTFLSQAPTVDGAQSCSLAAGPSDGFTKKILGLLSAFEDNYVITPIALEGGTTITINGTTSGGVELVWNAETSKWEVLAGQNITVA